LSSTFARRESTFSVFTRDAAEWSRFSEEQHCWYARTVIKVKRFWGLSVDAAEKEALATMLLTCSP